MSRTRPGFLDGTLTQYATALVGPPPSLMAAGVGAAAGDADRPGPVAAPQGPRPLGVRAEFGGVDLGGRRLALAARHRAGAGAGLRRRGHRRAALGQGR